jgi:hemolysin-activating ACP:hemolysin acyltransferase
MRFVVFFMSVMLTPVLYADQVKAYTHHHKPCICDKPVIFDETSMEKLFEYKGEIFKVLKGDDTNPTILYKLDTKTNMFIRIKQQ